MRTVQEMIHTEKCLESLPETALLWEMGLLQSEQVRLLCRMGEPVWERAWAWEAQHMSVRQLAEWIQRRKAAIQREREALAAEEAAAAGSGTAEPGGAECGAARSGTRGSCSVESEVAGCGAAESEAVGSGAMGSGGAGRDAASN